MGISREDSPAAPLVVSPGLVVRLEVVDAAGTQALLDVTAVNHLPPGVTMQNHCR
jgi:hypothetical protein